MANIKLRKAYTPSVFSDFQGFASGDLAYKSGSNAFAIKLKNFELTEENKPISARGHAQLGTATWNDNRIREIIQYRNDGTDVLLAFGSDSAGTSGAIATVSDWQSTSGLAFTETLVLSDFTENAVLMQVKNFAYLFNGLDDKYFDGSSWYSIGADAPGTAPSFNSNVAGSLNTSSTYTVGYCWYDSINNRRTNSSSVVQMTSGASAASAGLRVNLPGAGAPDGYDKVIVLCTVAYGSQLLEDQIVDASSSTADIISSDAVRLTQYVYEGGNDPPSIKFNIACFGNNRIYAGRTDDAGCVIYRSKVSPQFGAMPQSFNPIEFTECEPNASDKLVGIGVCGLNENQTIIVIKQKSFGKLVKVSDEVEIYQKIGDFGGDGHKSIFQLGQYCGFKTTRDIILTDGSSILKISEIAPAVNISDYLLGLSQSNRSRIYAKNITRDKQIRISVIPDGQAWPKQLLLGHYGSFDSKGFVSWTTREQGPNTTTYPGVQAACIAEVLDSDDSPIVIYGNSQGNGKLYEADVGTDDDGASIYKEAVFRPENFGDFENEKTFSDINIKIKTGDSSTAITFGCRKNLSESFNQLIQKTISGSGFQFGSGQFGITAFSNAPIHNLIIPCQIRAREMALVIRETTTRSLQIFDFTMRATT